MGDSLLGVVGPAAEAFWGELIPASLHLPAKAASTREWVAEGASGRLPLRPQWEGQEQVKRCDMPSFR